MKTQGNFKLKTLILALALVGFALPSNAHVIFEEIHYKHPHQYVYYPKQNFYYDPMFGQYFVVEDGVWVRQPYPPRLLRKININVLPHTDIYMTTMYPYHYNAEHRRTYHLMAVLTPSTAFYAFKMPNRYDFSIGPYVYYCRPAVQIAFVEYNPNYYCHPFVGRPHRHHGPDRYGYLTVYARNDYYYYHHIPNPHPFRPPYHYGHPGPPRYAYGPERHNNPYNGHPYKGHPNDNRRYQPAPPMNHGNGKGHGNHGGYAPSHGQMPPQQPNRPQPGMRPEQGGKGHGNNRGGGKTRAEVPKQDVDIRQGNPKQPNGFQKTVNSATTVAIHAMDKPNRNQDHNKVMHQKETVMKHQFDYIDRENLNGKPQPQR